MLVLSRRAEERIMIGGDIVITILEIHHDQVRIGIDAPRSIEVHREEVYKLVQAANESAVPSGSSSLEALRRFNVEESESVGQQKSVAQLGKHKKGQSSKPDPQDKNAPSESS